MHFSIQDMLNRIRQHENPPGEHDKLMLSKLEEGVSRLMEELQGQRDFISEQLQQIAYHVGMTIPDPPSESFGRKRTYSYDEALESPRSDPRQRYQNDDEEEDFPFMKSQQTI